MCVLTRYKTVYFSVKTFLHELKFQKTMIYIVGDVTATKRPRAQHCPMLKWREIAWIKCCDWLVRFAGFPCCTYLEMMDISQRKHLLWYILLVDILLHSIYYIWDLVVFSLFDTSRMSEKHDMECYSLNW